MIVCSSGQLVIQTTLNLPVLLLGTWLSALLSVRLFARWVHQKPAYGYYGYQQIAAASCSLQGRSRFATINQLLSKWEVFGAAPNTSFTEQPLATTHQVLGEYTFLASNQWFPEGRRPVSIFHRKSFKEIQSNIYAWNYLENTEMFTNYLCNLNGEL